MHGAATSPHVDVFIRAAAQVKKAMEVTHRLGGRVALTPGGGSDWSHGTYRLSSIEP
jgi:xylose isomerase